MFWRKQKHRARKLGEAFTNVARRESSAKDIEIQTQKIGCVM